MSIAQPRYERGLEQVGDGVWAWLQPDGGWGWSNAGLIEAGDGAVLIDTLFDLKLTAEMLAAMRARVPAAARIGTLVNTHANGDHCYGNSLVEGAEVIASRASAHEMSEVPAAMLAGMMAAAPTMGELGDYLIRIFGSFRFEGIGPTRPTRTFDGALSMELGGRRIDLIEVGPAHTAGDVLVHLPDSRTLFTGDILFAFSTPIMWAGPVGNWIAACDLIRDLDVETVVPGHGPVTDLSAVNALRDYLVYVRDEAWKRFQAGLGPEEAARDIALGDWANWGDAERIAVNVDTLYREFAHSHEPPNIAELFTRMARLARDRR
jgi:glyoxylase-like metal-dependent hydrolase (beta-lactamase superfamily II)